MDSKNNSNKKIDTETEYIVKIKLDKKGYLILAEQQWRNYKISYTKEGKVDITQFGKGGRVVNHLVCSKKSIFTFMKIITGGVSLYDVVGSKIRQNNLGPVKRLIRKFLVNLKYKINEWLDNKF